jgi:hypothetical protein
LSCCGHASFSIPLIPMPMALPLAC